MDNQANNERLELFVNELNSCIGDNYEVIRNVFNKEYGYPEFDPLRDEICKCVLCDLHQAAITLTNHLLESSLKKCLAMKHSISIKQNDIKIEDAFKEGITKFDQLDLDDTINRACTQGLITKEQKTLLKKFKDEFRNPYSHATTSEIFKDTTVKGKTISLNEGESPENLLKRIFDNDSDEVLAVKDLLPIQGLVQVMIAKQISVPYFTEVDRIIREMLIKLKPNS
jgi:hypothetical protein